MVRPGRGRRKRCGMVGPRMMNFAAPFQAGPRMLNTSDRTETRTAYLWEEVAKMRECPVGSGELGFNGRARCWR